MSPPLVQMRSSKAFVIATLCLALFTDDFIYGIIVPILPFSLPQKSHIPQHEVQFWTSAMLTAFGLANLIGSVPLGYIADRSPRKGFLLFGLFLLAAATLLFGFVTNVYLLVASRLLQRLSASIVYIGGFALLVDTVSSDEIGKWMGFVMSFGNLGLLISPFLGGVVYGGFGYYAVFASMMVFVGLDIIMRFAMVTKGSRNQKRGTGVHRDAERIITPGPGEDDSFIPLAQIDASGPLDWKISSETKEPLFLSLLRSPRVLTAVHGVLVAQTLITSFDGVLGNFFNQAFGWGSSRVGFLFLAITVPTIASPISGTLADRYGPKWVAVSGYGIAALSLVPLGFVGQKDSIAQVALLCVLLIALGVAFSLMISPLAADLAASVEDVAGKSNHVDSSSSAPVRPSRR